MKLNRIQLMVNCPDCGKRHSVQAETMAEINGGSGQIHALAKCKKIFTVLFSVINEKPVKVVALEGTPFVTEKEKFEYFTQYLKEKVSGKVMIDLNEIEMKSRKRDVVFSRYVIFHLLRKRFPAASLNQIGNQFQCRPDHATVLHGFREIDRLMFDPSEKERQRLIRELEKELFLVN